MCPNRGHPPDGRLKSDDPRRLFATIYVRIEENCMARGVNPRQPAKSGRHEGARSVARGQAGRGAKSVAANRGRNFPKAAANVTGKTEGKASSPQVKHGKGRGRRPQGYDPLAPERISGILHHLDQLYPEATCALHHRNAWELLVATILSAQSTDVNVNRVTPVLFAKYSTVQDFAALTPEQLEPDVRSTGFFRNKSKSVVGAAKKIVSEFGGQVPEEIETILTLPGVARKTANVVLGTWFKKAVGVVVDTHVHRISRRWEFTQNDDPVKIEQDLMKIIPRDRWILYSHQVIHHGRNLCVARKPKCADCPIEPLCHAEDKTWTTVEVHKGAKA
jgi:endonuclease-3